MPSLISYQKSFLFPFSGTFPLRKWIVGGSPLQEEDRVRSSLSFSHPDRQPIVLVCDRTGFSSFGRNRNSALQNHRTTVTEQNHLQNQPVSAEPASFGRKDAILAEMWLVLQKIFIHCPLYLISKRSNYIK